MTTAVGEKRASGKTRKENSSRPLPHGVDRVCWANVEELKISPELAGALLVNRLIGPFFAHFWRNRRSNSQSRLTKIISFTSSSVENFVFKLLSCSSALVRCFNQACTCCLLKETDAAFFSYLVSGLLSFFIML